jgi:hypothetical protein
MPCKRFHDCGAEELERGRRDLEHLLACRTCRRLDEGQRAVGDAIASLPGEQTPTGAWQAQVWSRIARGSDRPESRPRSRAVFALIYAAVLLLVGVMSANAYAQDARARSVTAATMDRVVHAVDTSIALVEVEEAEADLRFQMVHVAYAQARASRPDAGPQDVALVEARTRALQELSERHQDALTTLAVLD